LQPQGDAPETRSEIEFFPGKDGIEVLARSDARSRLMFHGAEVTQVLVRWGEELFLDDVIRITFIETQTSRSRSTSLLLGARLSS
jgi:hypothetical protein